MPRIPALANDSIWAHGRGIHNGQRSAAAAHAQISASPSAGEAGRLLQGPSGGYAWGTRVSRGIGDGESPNPEPDAPVVSWELGWSSRLLART